MRVGGDFDDRSYLCAAQKWVGVFSENCPQTSHFSGVAVSWFPALGLARFFSFFTEDSFEAWAGFWVGLSSFLFWVLSLFLIDQIIRLYPPKKEATNPAGLFISSPIFPALFLLNIPILYFATTRTFMVHTPELFWSLLFVYDLKKSNWKRGLLALGVLLATRPGNLGAVFLIPAFLESSPLRQKISKLGWAICFLGIGAVSAWLLSKLMITGYNGTFLIPLILDFQWQSLRSFFFAEDFGLVWSQFVWLVGLFLWLRYFKRGSGIAAASGFWLYLSALATLFWPTRGSTFGYRYLIGSYAGVLLIFLETMPLWSLYLGNRTVRLAKILLVFGALWGSIQCWIYPAPKPYWPWEKPLHTQVGIPYGQLVNWIKQAPDLVKMNRFSQAGQLAEKTRLISPSQFTRQGGVRDYALSGTVGGVNLFVSGLSFFFLIFALVNYLLPRKKPTKAKRKARI